PIFKRQVFVPSRHAFSPLLLTFSALYGKKNKCGRTLPPPLWGLRVLSHLILQPTAANTAQKTSCIFPLSVV
ncbi:hypothetical protein, partial [Neglectibacter sp. 59]|uniref:hypothetical protein n=1 Tax=Neglectibacter sp. 59 TaxID=2304573 RepID=UPI001A9B5C2F